MRSRIPLLLACGMLLLVSAACGDDDAAEPDVPPPAPAPDTGVEPDPFDEWDDTATQAARDAAHGVLGMYEEDLPEGVRVGQRGDEQMMLTQDYVLGRLTVELDDTDGAGYRVTSVTVELPDGPETYQLEGG